MQVQHPADQLGNKENLSKIFQKIEQIWNIKETRITHEMALTGDHSNTTVFNKVKGQYITKELNTMTDPNDLKGLIDLRTIQIRKEDRQETTLTKGNVGLAEKKIISDQNVQMSSVRIVTTEVILDTNATKCSRKGDR